MTTVKYLYVSLIGSFLLCILIASSPAIASDEKQLVVFDLLQDNVLLTIQAEGLGDIETFHGQKNRWLYGPAATFQFFSSVGRPAGLACDLSTPFDEQFAEIVFNGEVVRKFDMIKGGKEKNTLRFEVPLPLRKGVNTLEIRSRRWNGGEDVFAKEDSRQMALLLTKCVLALTDAKASPQPEQKRDIGQLRSVFQARRVMPVFEASHLELAAVGIGPAVAGSVFRPAFGDMTRFVFFNDAYEGAQFDFSLNSPLEGQTACVRINDASRDCFSVNESLVGKSYPFQARKGFNEIVIAYAKSELAVPLDFPIVGRPSANFVTCQITKGL
ncbi:hypothetical protein [Solidesulfovibrio sp.]